MDKIAYIGEFLLPRQIGHFAIVLGFISAALAAIAYFFATQNDIHKNPTLEKSWQRIGRIAFGVHAASIVTMISCVFYVMITKRLEYFYAHSHVDMDLPFRYVFAAFWEGQEGSFMLWIFWHVVLAGIVLVRSLTSKTTSVWESPVLTIVCAVQVFLTSMILGLHLGVGEYVIKWGSNPMLLLRETMDAPIFTDANYIEKIRPTAKGLNPLLQNYWMTIHPPTLFLGFASTVMPFAFAMAAIWTRRYTEWLHVVTPWSLFAAAILGTGILMGGAWAYEALNFNGYWAWDPVENMSLVPWLTLVAGIHTQFVARATGHSIRATVGFYFVTFLLILYATFLTRSGILGNTSVHAFTEMGLEWQLVILQLFFLVLAVWQFAKHYRHIPAPEKEESLVSREFWMFIGSLVLLMSVVLIAFTTSIPVYSKVWKFIGDTFHFKTADFTAPVDAVASYNKTQVWIGIFIGLLSGVAQYFRFKATKLGSYQRTFFLHLGIALAVTAGLTWAANGWIIIRAWQYQLLLFSGLFTVVSNLDYWFTMTRRNYKVAASVLSHVGFGLLIVGILASNLNKEWISKNRFAMAGLAKFSEEQLDKNVLVIKGREMPMANGYTVKYLGDTTEGHTRTFDILFLKKDPNTLRVVDSFTLHPYILYDKHTGKLASTNPNKAHYISHDVFGYIATLPEAEMDPEKAQKQEDAMKYSTLDLLVGQAVMSNGYNITLEGIDWQPKHRKYLPETGDFAVGLKVKIQRGDTVSHAQPLVLLRGENVYALPETDNTMHLRVKGGKKFMDKLLSPPDSLQYKAYTFKQEQTQTIGTHKITLAKVNTDAVVPGFTKREGDIVLGAQLQVQTADGRSYTAEPFYLIRDKQVTPIRADVNELGLHFVISKVSPETATFAISIADNDPAKIALPIDLAENAPSDNFIVLEATINPGINYVWLGSILMMLGFAFAMVVRWKK